jgi:hypothetical protein
MATLTGNSIASTYTQLLKLTSATLGADASAKYIEDGAGTDSALSISTTRVGIGTAVPEHLLQVKTSEAAGTSFSVNNRLDNNIFTISTYTDYGYMRLSDGSGTTKVQLNSSSDSYFNGGNVGINESSPAHKLEVGGDIGVAGNYLLDEQGRQNHVANTMSSPYYRFDGVDDIITVTDSPHLDGFTKFSITGSIYLEGSGANGIVHKYTTAGQKAFVLYLNGSQQLNLIVSSDGTNGEEQVATTALTVGVWNHFAITFDNGTFLAYVNGAVSAVDANFTSHTSVHSGSDNMIIGDAIWAGYELDGSLSNLKIWNNALTATEVKSLASGASVPFKYKGANQTALTGTDDMADDGTSDWTTDSDCSVAFDSDHYEVTYVGNTQNFYRGDLAVTAGKSYRISVQVKNGTYSSAPIAIYVAESLSTSNVVVNLNLTTTASWVTHSVEFTAESDTDTVIFFSTMTSSGNYEIKDVLLVQIGAVAEYDGSGIASDKWFDKSGNDLHGIITAGATAPSVENAPSGDDGLVYEEGEFDIGFTDPAGDLVVNASYNVGAYTRIGRVVHAQGNIRFASGTASGDFVLTGLPYTTPDWTEKAEASVASIFMDGLASAIDGYISGYISGTSIYVRENGLTGDGADLGVHIDGGTSITFQATYMID